MGGGGSINAMNISLKNNKRPKKKVIFDKKLQPFVTKKSDNLKKLLEKRLPKENLKRLKVRLVSRKKREQQIEVIIFSLLLTIGIMFIISLFIIQYNLPFLDKLD